MSYKTISELESISDLEQRKTLYKQVESELYRENRLFLAAQLIGGFFPGLAIIGFIEGYRRFETVRNHPFIVAAVMIAIVISIWVWKDHYRDKRIAIRLREKAPGV